MILLFEISISRLIDCLASRLETEELSRTYSRLNILKPNGSRGLLSIGVSLQLKRWGMSLGVSNSFEFRIHLSFICRRVCFVGRFEAPSVWLFSAFNSTSAMKACLYYCGKLSCELWGPYCFCRFCSTSEPLREDFVLFCELRRRVCIVVSFNVCFETPSVLAGFVALRTRSRCVWKHITVYKVNI